MIKNEIKSINSSRSELKKFGLTVGSVFFVIGLLLFYFDKSPAPYFLVVGAVLVILGAFVPKYLFYIHRIWMSFAFVMGFFMTRVILSVLFYIVLTPVGIIAKISGKDFLDLQFKENKATYWNYREKKEYKKIDTERQF